MSLGSRATTRGGAKSGKDGKNDKVKMGDKPHNKDKAKQQDKGKGGEKSQPKERIKPQATTEQLRMASMIDRKSDDSTDVRRMVLELMEMTCRTEEEVCSALHDADNDLQAACHLLLDQAARSQGEWHTSGEKKKKKPPAAAEAGDAEPPREPRRTNRDRPSRGRGGGGGGGGGGAMFGESRRGGGGGGRGRGGARGRGRRPAPQGGRDHQPSENNTGGDSFPATEDWDNEEWSGSLSDTKVFTPSVQQKPPEVEPAQMNNSTEEWEPSDTHTVPSYTYHNAAAAAARPANSITYNNIPSMSSSQPPAAAAAPAPKIEPDAYRPHQPMGMSGSLSAAQTQYLSTLTQQAQRHDNSVFVSGYGGYGGGALAPRHKPQRAKLPPPSKIPSLAVEMPGGAGDAAMFDVQFGALDDQVSADSQPATHDVPTENNSYTNTNNISSEPTAVISAEPTPAPVPEPTPATNNSLENQLSSSMKQMKVTQPEPEPTPVHHQRHKPAVTSAPAVAAHYPNVYAAQPAQVNVTAASMSTPSYPAVTQYQPTMLNSYQQQAVSVTAAAAGVGGGAGAGGAASYAGGALYTHAPYYPTPHKDNKQHAQYDSTVASSNSLTNTSTTQTTNASKVTTTVSTAVASTTGGTYVAGGALYQQQQYGVYDEHVLRHHMGGYYEVGYGVGGRSEGTFPLSDRFARQEAASPQQVPAALPPGYAYFYQPPPTTYQYGTVYPTYGTGSNVSGVSGAGKVGTYTQQPYEAPDTYKQGANYAGGKAAALPASAEISSAAMYKPHQVTKLNSYEKAGFHGGTPPPFPAAHQHHLYIPHHHHQHQMDVRVNSSQNRRESGAGGGSAAAAARPAQAKPYSQSYWPNN